MGSCGTCDYKQRAQDFDFYKNELDRQEFSESKGLVEEQLLDEINLHEHSEDVKSEINSDKQQEFLTPKSIQLVQQVFEAFNSEDIQKDSQVPNTYLNCEQRKDKNGINNIQSIINSENISAQNLQEESISETRELQRQNSIKSQIQQLRSQIYGDLNNIVIQEDVIFEGSLYKYKPGHAANKKLQWIQR